MTVISAAVFQGDALDDMRDTVESFSQNHAPSRMIADYDVIEVLGSGAFGTVYKVRKVSNQSYLALKKV